MLGLTLPAHIVNRDQLNESDMIMVPASSAIRVVLALFDQWRIPVRSQPRMLGVNSNTLSKYRRGNHPTREVQLLYIEDILAIHKALIVLLSAQAGSVLHWIKGRNEALMGKSPMELMLSGGLREVRRYLEGELQG